MHEHGRILIFNSPNKFLNIAQMHFLTYQNLIKRLSDLRSQNLTHYIYPCSKSNVKVWQSNFKNSLPSKHYWKLIGAIQNLPVSKHESPGRVSPSRKTIQFCLSYMHWSILLLWQTEYHDSRLFWTFWKIRGETVSLFLYG